MFCSEGVSSAEMGMTRALALPVGCLRSPLGAGPEAPLDISPLSSRGSTCPGSHSRKGSRVPRLPARAPGRLGWRGFLLSAPGTGAGEADPGLFLEEPSFWMAAKPCDGQVTNVSSGTGAAQRMGVREASEEGAKVWQGFDA